MEQQTNAIRAADDSETLVRFVFGSHIRKGHLKKGALRVAPNPETSRLELSVFRLDDLSADSFWEDMPMLGNRPDKAAAKGYGCVEARNVRKLGQDVEVNNQPIQGHADIIQWSDDPEERMEQIVELGKSFRGVKKPGEGSDKTPEHQRLIDMQNDHGKT